MQSFLRKSAIPGIVKGMEENFHFLLNREQLLLDKFGEFQQALEQGKRKWTLSLKSSSGDYYSLEGKEICDITSPWIEILEREYQVHITVERMPAIWKFSAKPKN